MQVISPPVKLTVCLYVRVLGECPLMWGSGWGPGRDIQKVMVEWIRWTSAYVWFRMFGNVHRNAANAGFFSLVRIMNCPKILFQDLKRNWSSCGIVIAIELFWYNCFIFALYMQGFCYIFVFSYFISIFVLLIHAVGPCMSEGGPILGLGSGNWT